MEASPGVEVFWHRFLYQHFHHVLQSILLFPLFGQGRSSALGPSRNSGGWRIPWTMAGTQPGALGHDLETMAGSAMAVMVPSSD